jgi:hypothetical protein
MHDQTAMDASGVKDFSTGGFRDRGLNRECGGKGHRYEGKPIVHLE